MDRAASVQALHEQCAIYTAPATASRLLDYTGWTERSDLTKSVLLEPCVGDGAILTEAARRLIASFRNFGVGLSEQKLAPRLKGYEIHRATAATARKRVERLLVAEGVHRPTAHKVARAWVRTADFLRERRTRPVTHVAANPPYIRWSKLPAKLSAEYRSCLPAAVTRGDLAVAFLDCMLAWSGRDTVVAALVSDRWMFAQFGDRFRAKCAEEGWKIEVVEERPRTPFTRKVGAYSSIVRFQKVERFAPATARSGAQNKYAELIQKYGTLTQAGCSVRVGPALGCGQTYLLEPDDAGAIEGELIRPYLGRQALTGGTILRTDSRVVIPFDQHGRLIDLHDYPGFAAWIRKNESALKVRSQVQNGLPWWSTIDSVGTRWRDPRKLVIPELSRSPQSTLDLTGGVPAHSIYAIWSNDWPLDALQRVLNGGLLQLTATAIAPRLSNGWVRFYKRFIDQTPLPRWQSLPEDCRESLSSDQHMASTFERLFGLDYRPAAVPKAEDSSKAV